MSYPSQVVMNDVPLYMTQGYIMNVVQKLGHHPIRATISKDRKSDKGVCTIQFANEDLAKEAISKLNGKSITISGSGSTSTVFKLTQCSGNNVKVYSVSVNDLIPEIDDNRLFRFFNDRFKTLCHAKVIVDNRGKSVGRSVLKFLSEEDQKFCVKIMNGSVDLGNKPIKVSLVPDGSARVNLTPMDMFAIRFMNGDPWCRYTSWNQFVEPPEYPFVAVKVNLTPFQDENNSLGDHELVKYNVTSNMDYLNHESLERDCYLWDALECSKWLPGMALTLPPNEDPEVAAEPEAQSTPAKKKDNSRTLSNGTPTSDIDSKETSKRDDSFSRNSKNVKKTYTPSSKSSSSRSSKFGKRGATKVVDAGRLSLREKSDLRGRVKATGVATKRSAANRGLPSKNVSKISAQLLTGLPLKKPVSPRRPPSVQKPSSSKNALMDKLADEISDSLTKLFTGKHKSAMSRPRLETSPHKSARADVICYRCGDRGHIKAKCNIPETAGKVCFCCHKIATHLAENCPEKHLVGKRKFSHSPLGDRWSPSRDRWSPPGDRWSPPRPLMDRWSPPTPSMKRMRSISPPSQRYIREFRSPPREGRGNSDSRDDSRGPWSNGLKDLKCRACGKQNHDSKSCRFRNSVCRVCNKIGHISTICRFR